jgi:hypothetical protein
MQLIVWVGRRSSNLAVAAGWDMFFRTEGLQVEQKAIFA